MIYVCCQVRSSCTNSKRENADDQHIHCLVVTTTEQGSYASICCLANVMKGIFSNKANVYTAVLSTMSGQHVSTGHCVTAVLPHSVYAVALNSEVRYYWINSKQIVLAIETTILRSILLPNMQIILNIQIYGMSTAVLRTNILFAFVFDSIWILFRKGEIPEYWIYRQRLFRMGLKVQVPRAWKNI